MTQRNRIGAAAITAVSIAALIAGAAAQDRRSQVRTAFSGKLPGLDGQRLEVRLVEVTYPPGGSNPAHRHPCPVVGHVLDGAVRMQVDGQPERIFMVDGTFYESPADVHRVSADASQDVPARFLAYFVGDRTGPLSVPVTGEEKRP